MSLGKFIFEEQEAGLSMPLKKLYEDNGSCMMNGFLGDENIEFSFDEEGRLQYYSTVSSEEVETKSVGVVLSRSVLIKQIQTSKVSKSYNLYSWNVDDGEYTFLSFDGEDALNRYFDTIKRFDYCLCDDDISMLCIEMGLNFNSVNQILLKQKTGQKMQTHIGGTK